jgi:hypothetical protein
VIGVEGVSYDEPVLTFTLVFDTTAESPLVVNTLDPAKWSGVYLGGAMAGLSADVVAFDRIQVSIEGPAGGGGASSVSYSNAPSDVSDTLGRTLAAFEGFPF